MRRHRQFILVLSCQDDLRLLFFLFSESFSKTLHIFRKIPLYEAQFTIWIPVFHGRPHHAQGSISVDALSATNLPLSAGQPDVFPIRNLIHDQDRLAVAAVIRIPFPLILHRQGYINREYAGAHLSWKRFMEPPIILQSSS